jgi:hypothetical protein
MSILNEWDWDNDKLGCPGRWERRIVYCLGIAISVVVSISAAALSVVCAYLVVYTILRLVRSIFP